MRVIPWTKDVDATLIDHGLKRFAVVDASMLGLATGQWPDFIRARTLDGDVVATKAVYALGHVLTDGGRVYTAGSLELHVRPY